MDQTIKSTFKQAHSTAWSTVSADDSLPDLNVNALLTFLNDILVSGKNGRAAVIKKYVDLYGPAFKTYGALLSEDFFSRTIQDYLEKSNREDFRALAENDFARCLVQSSEKILPIIATYFKKGISDEEFLELMSKTGIEEVGMKMMTAFGINPSNLNFSPEAMLKLTGPVLAYQGAMGAYREYSQAMEDLHLARESRLRVEAECQKTIELIRTYRLDAEQRVSEYMNKHLDAFLDGFAAMDQAIAANDPDGYIAGNVQIQQILGADVQFTTQQEFDALMESDEDFIF